MKKKYMHACMQARSASLVGAGTIAAMLSASGAIAQQNTADPEIEEVVVTGSLISRSGYDAPTPVSALGEEAFEQMPVTQIGELVDRLPVFQGSQNARNNVSISDGTSGTNLLDLRGLGANRTLVLLDGKRVVGSSIGGARGGAVDISNFPSGLVRRVEVITGGASATYGADALAGVVNFMLDKEYTGFKVRSQGSMTTHGDGEAYQLGFTAGTPFADDKGHFLIDVERGFDAGIEGKPRDWADPLSALVRNSDYAPGNGEPFYKIIPDAGLSVVTRGGLITGCTPAGGGACPLRGTQFQNGGTPIPFEFGEIHSGIWMQGGDWETSTIHKATGLALEQERDSVFLRTSYDLTNSANVYGEFMYSDSHSVNPGTALPFRLGNVTIKSGNPFIPASVQATMDAQGIDSFTMGTVNGDAGAARFEGRRQMQRFVVGAEGEAEVFGSNWDWDVSYVDNESDILQRTPNNMINSNYNRAVDAVVGANGQIVCSVNADSNPDNDDPNCVPYNNMGTGVLSPAAKDYAFGTGWATMLLEQEVLSGSVTGEPFENWAGPVSLAFGASYRAEEVSGETSELDQQAVFLGGNYNPTFGEYDVTEFFAETVVPLLKDAPLAQQLDVNAAIRTTDYSTSGEVDTWKLGLSWRPHDDVRVRATRSRDIRAPSLGDLFDAGTSGTGSIDDPFTGQTTQFISQTRGNPNIQPEIGDTNGIGVIYQPSWLPEFSVSVDYYNIEVTGAILTVGTQEILQRCYEGNTALCDSVIRGSDGLIDMVLVQPQNLLLQEAAGWDIEASYRYPLSNISSGLEGDLSFRAMVTLIDKLDTTDGQSTHDGVGVTGPERDSPGFGLTSAKNRYLASVTYANGAFDTTLTARGMGSGVYSNRYVECVPGSCPTSGDTINDNHIDSINYFDLGFNYRIGNGRAFFAVQNMLDEDPPHVATTSFWSGPGNMNFYDRMGRIVRVGFNYEL